MSDSLPPLSGASLASRMASVATAGLRDVADRLHTALREVWPHDALVIFTKECTGRPRKKAGDPLITEGVTISELDSLRDWASPGLWTGEAVLGGRTRSVALLGADTGALLVLCGPRDPVVTDGPAHARALWDVASVCIAHLVAEARPDYLRESRAATHERLEVTAELTDRHSTDLESLLAVLRGRNLDDSTARAQAIDLAADALIRTRTGGDLVVSIAEEPVVTAFERLRSDLSPLSRYQSLQIQFVEPPSDGRALPGEVAHAARAIVRSTVLLMREQEDVTRVRVQWNCDGTNLLVSVRDDGPGRLNRELPAVRQLVARAASLGGLLDLEAIDNWGSRVEVRLPLDASQPLEQLPGSWGLRPREIEVLRLLTAGQRNRQIAARMGISENTVKFHTSRIYRKLGVTSRAAAATVAAEAGLR
ncbi:LuxR family transcriptional regulator [Streptomyces sp. GF20]|uniref:LuxR C-terminal-related transcriptional regulator n=1 Tax=Streptomyces sp. GF20 TaxID=2692235 RepID=UPI001316976A|nr:LuxR C-terminal-related transcriptional regulator [Streptomyces sp. GF20]QHC18880.1 LuxR family transcriptional regulator [Streptomyces sp. GF20]